METGSHIVNLRFVPQDPDEDEETRQYRLKIEQQKRLREEILKKKEMRRQMQAGVRKKELMERLNSHTNTPSQGPVPAQIQSAQQNQQIPPVQKQPQPPQQQPQQQPHLQPEQNQQLLQPQQQQRQFPQRTQQSLNQSLKNPNPGAPIPPNGTTQTLTPRPNVKTRLQMVKGNTPLQQTPGPVPDQQWKPPQTGAPNQQLQQQQRRSAAVQNLNRPGTQIQPAQNNIPVTPSLGPGQAPAQSQGPKPGAKRTVMQRAKNAVVEGQQVPQKVRVVKLSGAVSIQFHLCTTLPSCILVRHLSHPLQLIFTHKGNHAVVKWNSFKCHWKPSRCLFCNLKDI